MIQNRFLMLTILGIFLLPHKSCLQAQDTLKSYYQLWSVNRLFPMMPEPLKTRISALSIVPGIRHFPVHLDGFGYYRPRGDRWLYGGVLQLCIDRYSAYNQWFQIEYYQPSASVIYFLDKPINHSGLYVRGDAGPALMRLASKDAGHEKIILGFGILTSGGYSFRYHKIHIMLSVNYSFKLLGFKPYHFISTGPGLMF